MSITEQPKPQTREITPISQPDAPTATGFLVDTGRFEHLWRVATCFAKSDLVPDVFKRKPDNCFIAAQLSLRLGVDLFALMQNIYIVHGKPGFEAKLVIGLLNSSSKTIGPVRYRFSGEGDDYGCEAVVVDAFTKEELVGPKVDWKTVKAEGWNKPKKSEPSKWATMPELMFRYRAAMFLARAHYPEVMMGMNSREEIEDTTSDVEPRRQLTNLDDLSDQLETETATEPDATEPQGETPHHSDADEEQFFADMEAAGTIHGVDAVLRDWLPQLLPAGHATAKSLAEQRKEQIRATRGNGSNTPKPAAEPEPTPKQLADRAANYARRMKQARSASALESVWSDVDSDPRITKSGKVWLRGDYEAKRADLTASGNAD